MQATGASVSLAVVLAFLCVLPVFSETSQAPEGTDTTPSCTEKSTLTLILQGNDREASFRCPSTWTLQPADLTQAYDNTDSSNTVALDTLVSGATLIHDSENSKYTLTLPSERTDKTFQYKCQKPSQDASGKNTDNSASQSCKIVVKVFASEIKSAIECKAGEINVATVKVTGNALSLKCKDLTLDPPDVQNVYDDEDGKCASKVALTSLVDGSLAAVAAEQEDNGEYALSISELPADAKHLCYKCVAKQSKTQVSDASKECMLKLTVASGAAAFATASISVGILASLASFLSAN
ncbi:SAG-related sequence SRS23 [Toxoplasma gondii ARI]|uniref:SAG-related sequence SRS23 n=2 Tax=Toxoplasma gondii TaxID=5811 RepID=A0A2G8YEB8_TOXGO|nr:SAG-related sequence SRS23 [Toxoplasma gondii ARI]PIM05617.1 SAG-related sequence SRS23 [Toxoplasma gondii COUG]